MKERVQLIGFRNDVPRLIFACDVVVNAAQAYESFGLVAVEAMALRRPVVASRVGGIPEVVVDGHTGFLIQPNDEVGFAERLATLWKSPELRRQMGEEGFARYASLFRADRMASRYWETLADDGGGGAIAGASGRWQQIKAIGDDSAIRYYFRSLLFSARLDLLWRTLQRGRGRWRRRLPESWVPLVAACLRTSFSCSPIGRMILPVVRLEGPAGYWGGALLPGGRYRVPADRIAWDRVFRDREDAMALHRFGWLWSNLAELGRVPWPVIEDWLHWSEAHPALPDWVQDSYSVAERICNFVFALHLDPPPGRLAERVTERLWLEARFLAQHLEYYGDSGTNNHILNDGRALVLAGAWLDRSEFVMLGLRILCDELGRHCDEEGVVRESSAHYQWVVTRWIIEVALALQGIMHPEADKFTARALAMTAVCGRLRLGGEREYIPTIGDVSPDFPPDWYLGMERLAPSLLRGETRGTRQRALRGRWVGLFGADDRGSPEGGSEPCWRSGSGEWVRLRKGAWGVLLHNDRRLEDTRASHGHNDVFSFELAWEGIPVVVDPGRRDYRSPLWGPEAALLEPYHNGLMVDERGAGFRPRPFMKGDWLVRHVRRATVSCTGNGATMTLRAPPQLPGVERIERSWALTQEGLMVVTRLCSSRAVEVRQFLRLNSESMDPVGPGCWHVAVSGGPVLALKIPGVSAVDVHLARRFPRYGADTSCIVASWIVPVDGDWLGHFSIRREVV